MINFFNKSGSEKPKPNPKEAIYNLRIYLLHCRVPAELEEHAKEILNAYDAPVSRKARNAAAKQATVLVGIIRTFGNTSPSSPINMGNRPSSQVHRGPLEEVGSITMAFRPNQYPGVVRDMVNLILYKAGVPTLPIPADQTIAVHYGVDLEVTVPHSKVTSLEEALAIDALSKTLYPQK